MLLKRNSNIYWDLVTFKCVVVVIFKQLKNKNKKSLDQVKYENASQIFSIVQNIVHFPIPIDPSWDWPASKNVSTSFDFLNKLFFFFFLDEVVILNKYSKSTINIFR
jgi:hypothetical protein